VDEMESRGECFVVAHSCVGEPRKLWSCLSEFWVSLDKHSNNNRKPQERRQSHTQEATDPSRRSDGEDSPKRADTLPGTLQDHNERPGRPDTVRLAPAFR
jgi:hypothetical protein